MTADFRLRQAPLYSD